MQVENIERIIKYKFGTIKLVTKPDKNYIHMLLQKKDVDVVFHHVHVFNCDYSKILSCSYLLEEYIKAYTLGEKENEYLKIFTNAGIFRIFDHSKVNEQDTVLVESMKKNGCIAKSKLLYGNYYNMQNNLSICS